MVTYTPTPQLVINKTLVVKQEPTWCYADTLQNKKIDIHNYCPNHLECVCIYILAILIFFALQLLVYTS